MSDPTRWSDERLAAHAHEWADLPLMGGRSELPAQDGDIAYLEELADILLDTAALIGHFDPGFVHGWVEAQLEGPHVEPAAPQPVWRRVA